MAGVLSLMTATADAADPVVIVSIHSLDELSEDAAWLGQRIGIPFLDSMLDSALTGLANGNELKGLDRSQPLGALLYLNEDGEPSEPLIFLPVGDEDELNETLALALTKLKEEDGITHFEGRNGVPVFGVIDGDWYFLSNKADALDDLPDPAEVVVSDADFAIDVDYERFPEALRESLIREIDERAERDQEAITDENERRGAEFGHQIVRRVLLDASRFTLTLEIDAETGVMALDAGLTAREETPTAAMLESYGEIQSTFSGLDTRDTVFSLVFAMPLSEDVQGFLVDAMTQGFNESVEQNDDLSDEDRQMAVQLLEVLTETLLQPAVDAGLVINNRRGKLQMLSAISVAEGEKLNELFLKAVKKEQPAELKLNAAEHNGTSIHAVTVKSTDPQSSKLLGDGPVNFAIAPDRLVMGMGVGAVAGVKQGLDAEIPEDSERAPVSLRIGVGAAMKLARDDSNGPLIDLALNASGDSPDRIVVELAPHEAGVSLRIELEEGVLKLIGFGVGLAMQGGNQ